MTMRAFVVMVAGGLLLASCGGSSPQGGAATAVPLEQVKVMWVAKVANMAPALVAHEAGYFKQQDLDVNLSYVNGSPTGMAALLAGEADFLQVAGTAVVTSASASSDSAKTPTLIIGTVNRAVWKLMGSKSITNVDQLRGKTLCITRAGTADSIALNLYLKRVNLDPSRDVTIISGGSIEGCVATLEANRAAAGVFSTPATATLASHGFGTLADFAKEGIEIQQLGVAVTKGYAQAHTATVLKFTKAYIQGIHRFKTDKPFAQKVMTKYLGTTDQAELTDAYDTYKDVFEKVPVPTAASLQSIIDTIPQAKGRSPSDFTDPSFVRKLQQDGFIKQVYGS